MVFTVCVEAVCLFCLERRVHPFPLGLEEESEGIGADVYTVQRCVLNTCDVSISRDWSLKRYALRMYICYPAVYVDTDLQHLIRELQ